MSSIEYRNHQLTIENCSFEALASQFGTPLYIYSQKTLQENYRAFEGALKQAGHPFQLCYAVKANSNLAILNLFASHGAGFDIVSIGELERVLAAGGDPKKIVFSGVGKRQDEIARALEVDIFCFNVESASELNLINAIATEKGKRARISLRINPDIDAKTHPYISTGLKDNKFGIHSEEALSLYLTAKSMVNIEIIGIDCHIGSQLTELEPFKEAVTHLLLLMDMLEKKGITLSHLDLGGGLGVRYSEKESLPSVREYINTITESLRGRSVKLLLEPGRALTANAGFLLTRVLNLKHGVKKNFAIVDAAMNDLMRPALYEAWQDILPVNQQHSTSIIKKRYDVVGPVCETGDWLGKDRELLIHEKDLLTICGAGAYGFSMSSNYNTRPRPAEVMVNGDQATLIRRRETVSELFAHEMNLSNLKAI
jgi:diaminopimelate decarboxylase